MSVEIHASPFCRWRSARCPCCSCPRSCASVARPTQPRRSRDAPSKPALAWRIMARRVGLSLAIAALLFVIATIATARWGNHNLWPPAPGAPTTEVFIVSHGYHAGIIVPRAALADEASRRGLSALGYLATRFADFDRLENRLGRRGLLSRGADGGGGDDGAGHARAVSPRQSFRAARGRRQWRSARDVRQFRPRADKCQRCGLCPADRHA